MKKTKSIQILTNGCLNYSYSSSNFYKNKYYYFYEKDLSIFNSYRNKDNTDIAKINDNKQYRKQYLN